MKRLIFNITPLLNGVLSLNDLHSQICIYKDLFLEVSNAYILRTLI